MLLDVLKTLFSRDLNKLQQEIELYSNEKDMWVLNEGISNSGGNLCLHIIGNLNTFIGAELGGIPYIRNRPLEFSLKDVPKSELLTKIEETKLIISKSLDKLTPKNLEEDYPLIVFETKMTTEFFLMHLATHLSYHLGQINYHRRLID